MSDLAERAAMSPRTFARRFLASTGTTPLQWILAERIRLAQRLLETTGLPVDAIAHKSGFGTPDNLRKHFAPRGPHHAAGLPPRLPGTRGPRNPKRRGVFSPNGFVVPRTRPVAAPADERMALTATRPWLPVRPWETGGGGHRVFRRS